jgi:hypothetical protein
VSVVGAASSNAAISQLRQAGYFPTSVIEEAIAAPTPRKLGGRRRRAHDKPREKGIVLFQRKS